jgi:hypothetical protein
MHVQPTQQSQESLIMCQYSHSVLVSPTCANLTAGSLDIAHFVAAFLLIFLGFTAVQLLTALMFWAIHTLAA